MDSRALSNLINLARMGFGSAVSDPRFSEANLAAMSADLAAAASERDVLAAQEKAERAEKAKAAAAKKEG